jgi:Asparagine synthase
MMSTGARVLLSGIGGDVLFAVPAPFPESGRSLDENLQCVADLWAHRRVNGSLRGLGLRNKLLPSWLRHKGWLPEGFPAWIRRDVALRTGMEERWWNFWQTEARTWDLHQQFARPWFGAYAQPYVDAVQPLRTRFPLWDVRLQEFCAALPLDVVWRKSVMIDAMRPFLPPEILFRPKSPVVGDLLRTQFRSGALNVGALHKRLSGVAQEWIDSNALAEGVNKYVRRVENVSTWEGRAMTAPLCLSMWQNRRGMLT